MNDYKIVTVEFVVRNNDDARRFVRSLENDLGGDYNTPWLRSNISDPTPEQVQLLAVIDEIENEGDSQ